MLVLKTISMLWLFGFLATVIFNTLEEIYMKYKYGNKFRAEFRLTACARLSLLLFWPIYWYWFFTEEF